MSIDDIRNQFEGDFDFSDEAEWEEEHPPQIFLGMTPAQRFVVAFLLFFIVIIISVFCLLVTGKIALTM
ncbi:MAG: hypothetical protein R6U57_04045 [Anaerolineales bacterium]